MGKPPFGSPQTGERSSFRFSQHTVGEAPEEKPSMRFSYEARRDACKGREGLVDFPSMNLKNHPKGPIRGGKLRTRKVLSLSGPLQHRRKKEAIRGGY